MADEEAEQDYCDSSGGTAALKALGERLQTLAAALKDSDESPAQSSAQYCQAFCQTLVEYANLWRTEEDPLPLVEVYMVALLSYAQASSSLSPQCEHVSLVLERLSLSYVELLLSLPEHVPSALWEKFRLSVKTAHTLLQENGISQLHMLCALAQEQGPWTNSSLQSILSNEILEVERVHEFLALEGPVLLDMRVKHLIKENRAEKAVLLAKVCSEFPAFEGKGCFKQMHLLCLCTVGAQEPLMEELSKVDCRDGLEMICNLEADGDEKGAFTLCSAFLTRQLLQEDTYCAWELTLFWSKLLRRLEPSEQRYLDKCKQMSCLSKTAFHILFFIKVIQSEMENIGLPTCIEMCVRALQMDSCDGNKKATICKTISCLLPTDLEVKRACQLTEFLLEPTVDSYYAVETLYNEPDGKPEEESLPVPNSLRCELLLVLKTQWPFDPEFWDWKTLKRHCLALMGEEASIVSSIDELNDGENPEEPVEEDSVAANDEFKDVSECFWDTTNELNEIADEKQKKRQIKKLREKGFVSARFRNWQAYMQYCVLCDKEFLGHRIVRHAQTHFKDGLYSCPICAETFDTKETLEPHVASHVKLSCKERLAAMKTSRKLAKTASSSKTAASVAADLKSKTGVSQVRKPKLKDSFNGDTLQLYSGDTAVDSQTEFPRIKRESTEENVCPVLKCRKGFKYFRNLLAHVKDHGDNEEAKRFLEMQSKKVVCQYCRRHFVSVSHLNDHLQVHCGTKPYICIQLNCKASFLSNAELLVHKKEHPVFKAKCMFPNCGKIFHEAYKLYDHEAQHYKTYTCKVPGCGKVFHSQGQLDLHMEGHVTKDDDSQTTENKSLQPVEETAYLTNHEIQRDEEQNCLMDVTMLNSLPEVEMSGHPLGPVKVKHSVESMLNNTVPDCTTQEYQTNTVKSELELSDPEPPNVQHSTCTDRSVLQPAVSLHMSHQSQPRTEESLIEALLSNHVPPSSVTSTSSFRSVIEDFLPTPSSDVLQSQIQTTVPQSQMQPVYSDGNPEFRQCIPNPGGPKSAPSQGLFLNTMPPTGQASYDTMPLMVGNLPAASQKAPVQVMPQPPNGHCENRLMQPSLTNIPTQSEGAKERHKCAFETCTRDYSSYRSVTKHMKAAHPEFYVQWKLAKKNNKVPKGITKCMSICGNLNSVAPSQNQLGKTNPTPVVQIQKAIGPPPPYPTPCQNSNNPPVSSHSAVLTNQTYSGQMEDMLNPILFSQMGSTPDQSIAMQSHTGPDSTWGSSPGNHNSVLHQQTCHAQPMTPNTNTLSAKPFHSYTHISTPDQTADAKLREMGQLTLPPQETFTTHLMMTQASEPQRHGSSSTDGLHPLYGPDFLVNGTPGVTPQVDVKEEALDNVNPSQQSIGSNVNGVSALQIGPTVDTVPHPVLPCYSDSLSSSVLSDCPRAPICTLQNQNSSFPDFTPPERAIKSDKKAEAALPLQSSSTLQVKVSNNSQNDAGSMGHDGEVKRTKRNKRTKWPAIVKDGKFICCRCFREFQSPKSLGGHLSKRLHCKAFDEADLTADLPASFLDLLNSPQLMNTSQPTTPSSKSKCTLDPQLFPNVTFPQANGSSYANDGEQNNKIFKQVLDNPAMPNLSESTGVQQPPYPNPCGSYAPDGRLLENTVIQHTGNILMKSEQQQDYTPSCDPLFNDSNFTDPLLLQLLNENHSAASLNNLPTDHINQILCAETLVKMKEVKGKVGSNSQGEMSNDGLLAAMATLAQNLMANPLPQITTPNPPQLPTKTSNLQVDIQEEKVEKNVKKRLREQILSGDIHRRNNLPQTSAADSNSSLRACILSKPVTAVSQPFGAQTLKEINTAPQDEQSPLQNNAVIASNAASQANDIPKENSLQTTFSSSNNALIINDQIAVPSVNEEDKIMEIQKAFERLDLDREVTGDVKIMDVCSSVEQSSNVILKDRESINSTINMSGFMKPFACDSDGCSYRAMTKDALFKHLTKMHGYTQDMLCEIKKNQMKFAPFHCQLCHKTFTRNSNLRAHYQTAHSLSQEEMLKLKVIRQYNRRPGDGDVESHSLNPSISDSDSLLKHPGECALSVVMQHQKDMTCAPNSISVDGKVKSTEYNSQSLVSQAATCQPVSDLPQDKSVTMGLPVAETTTHPSVIVTGHCSEKPPRVDQQSNGNYVSLPSESIAHMHGGPAEWPLHRGTELETQTPTVSAHTQPLLEVNPSSEKKPRSSKPRVAKPKDRAKMDTPKKIKEKKPEASDAFSPYRPYRCVHQGCVAAFTIQHNLILHYRAVHQSALPKFEVNNEDEENQEEDEEHEKEDEKAEKSEGDIIEVTEFRCQVKDCSRIFQEATHLLQHYLQLHKFSLDRAGALMSSISLGRFQCDQPGCTVFFTAFWKYVDHIDSDHKDTKLSKVEPVDGMFRCDVQGCNCAYTTRSNLLRHTMKKHHDIYKLQLLNQRKGEERMKYGPKKSSNGKENIENNKEVIQKGSEKKRKDWRNNHWTKYGKPSLKSKEEASKMCTKKFPLQYPCMIKGCESVMSSERNIMKHYIRHGLSEKYLEEQRSHFIFCKKIPRSRFRHCSQRSDDTEKSGESSVETSDNEDTIDTGQSESDYSKLTSGKESTEDPELSDEKPSTDDNSEISDSSAVVKRKRGRPRREDRKRTRSVPCKRVMRLRTTRGYSANYADINSDSTSSSTAAGQEELNDQNVTLNSFKPLGFEVSFLKFLEESDKSSTSHKRNTNKNMLGSFSLTQNPTIHLKTAKVVCKRSEADMCSRFILNHVEFKNPQKLTSLSNITFAVHETFSDVTDLLLKQLHEMQPMVILQKY